MLDSHLLPLSHLELSVNRHVRIKLSRPSFAQHNVLCVWTQDYVTGDTAK